MSLMSPIVHSYQISRIFHDSPKRLQVVDIPVSLLLWRVFEAVFIEICVCIFYTFLHFFDGEKLPKYYDQSTYTIQYSCDVCVFIFSHVM